MESGRPGQEEEVVWRGSRGRYIGTCQRGERGMRGIQRMRFQIKLYTKGYRSCIYSCVSVGVFEKVACMVTTVRMRGMMVG